MYLDTASGARNGGEIKQREGNTVDVIYGIDSNVGARLELMYGWAA
jgi:hypothetical protein